MISAERNIYKDETGAIRFMHIRNLSQRASTYAAFFRVLMCCGPLISFFFFHRSSTRAKRSMDRERLFFSAAATDRLRLLAKVCRPLSLLYRTA